MENSDKTRVLSTPNPAPSADVTMQSLAAELAAKKAAEQIRAVEEAAKELPAFRESSPQEMRQAEQLLRDANLARRREKFKDAEAKCREALALAPRDAVALEFLGDLMQGVARIDEALAAYKRATEADPARTSAERKYADLLMRQENWGSIDMEAVLKKPWLAVMLSLLFPGVGQFYNGETVKGIVFAGLGAACALFLSLSLGLGFSLKGGEDFVGKQGKKISTAKRAPKSISQLNVGSGTNFALAFGGVLYVVSLIDAAQGARGGSASRRKTASGWEV